MTEHKPAKVDKWEANAVKNALDDAVRYLMKTEYGCDEDHSLMNGRLLLSALGVAFALYAVIYDWYHPYPLSRTVLIVCVLSYFVLMGILTLYIMYKEKGIIYVGLEKDKAGIDPPNVWTFSSSQKKYDHIYELRIDFTDPVKKTSKTAELKESVTKYFDEKGTLREDIFHPALKNLVTQLKSNKKDN